MGIQDWVDLKRIQAISKHTIDASAAILSFMIISWLVKRGVGPGLISTFVEGIEKILLGTLFLVFVVNIGYDLFKELRRNVGSNSLVVA